MRRRAISTVVALALIGAGLQTPPAAAVPAGTVTFSDTSDLVHGQEIVVRGDGWDPRQYIAVTVCGGQDDDDQCEQIGWGRPGPAGRFGIRAEVDVVIELYEERIDCRVSECWLAVFAEGVWPEPPPIYRTATFDPAGPDPTRRVVDVSPTTDVVDGQSLTVGGAGFTGLGVPRTASVLPCRLPVLVQADCDAHALQHVRILEGRVDTTQPARAILQLEDGEHDCRVDECGLLVMDGWFEEGGEDLSEAGLVPLSFDPAAPLRAPPEASITPDAALVDGQDVTVTATGFDPGQAVELLQCQGTVAALPEHPDRCQYDTGQYVRADAQGEIDGRTFGVWGRIDDFGIRWDCRATPCSLVLRQVGPLRQAVVPLAFDPEGPMLRPRLTVHPARALDDGRMVTVTGTRFRANRLVVLAVCSPDSNDVFFSCDRRTLVQVRTGPPDGGRPGNRFEVTMRVRSSMTPPPGWGAARDCRVRRCVVRAQSGGAARGAEAPLHFAP